MSVFYTYKNEEMETLDFLQTLYHDKRGGQMIRLRLEEGQAPMSMSSCDIEELAATGTDRAGYYTTVHTFSGRKRSSETVFNYTSIYIDLDCHAEDPTKIQLAKDRTVQILEAAYTSGELALPTMITDSGRGYGIQYVLKRSIAAQTWRTEKTKTFFKKIREDLFKKYRDILAMDPAAAQADAAVLDDARVCRLPGTYNMAAGRYCRLISLSGKQYELSELVQGCHLWDWKSDEDYQKVKEEKEKKRREREKRLASGKIVSFCDFYMPFLTARLGQLQKIQDLRGKGCTDKCREQLLFISYSTLVQLDQESAPARLQDINKRFADPLDQKELDHIIASTDRSKCVDHRGFYKLKNRYLVERLDLSDSEIQLLGLDMSLRRTAERQAARDKKKEKKEKVIELLKQVDNLTYQEIAEMADVSRRTVCTIAKQEKLMRYRKAADRKCPTEQSAEIISIEDKKESLLQEGESAKNAAKSVCVPSPKAALELLSTPPVRLSYGSCWFSGLFDLVPTSSVACELLSLFSLSSITSMAFAVSIEDYFDRYMLGSLTHLDRLPQLRDTISRKFFKYLGLTECRILFGTFLDPATVPTLWRLCEEACTSRSKASKQASRVDHSYVAASRNCQTDTAVKREHYYSVPDYTTETEEHRTARLDFYLCQYKDKRFDVIEASDEYIRRLDPVVLREMKIACMQMKRVQREYFFVEKAQIPTKDIKAGFDRLSYKDLVTICERMAHQGTIYQTKKPFFYVVQCVWKYLHPDAAEAQYERLDEEKSKSHGFCNFKQRKDDYIDYMDLAKENAKRKILGMPKLTMEEFRSSHAE